MFLLGVAKTRLKYGFSIKWMPKSIIIRPKCDSIHEKWKITSERDFLRKVIENTDGCPIFTPSQALEPNHVQFHSDELIKKLIHLTRKFLLNRFDYRIDEKKMIQCKLPSLHQDCMAQSSKWSIEKNLFVMDIWKTYLDQQNEQLLFFNESMNRYLNQIHSLPDPIALQIMYYAACGWKWESNSYEQKIFQKMHKMMKNNQTSFDHMAIYCLALFKNLPAIDSTSFMDSFLKYLMEKDFENEKSIAVSCVIKAARKFATRDQIHQIENIQTKLIPYAENCDLISLTHIIQLGQNQRVHSRQLVELVLNRFEKNLNRLRLKEVERCLLSIATFDFESSNRIEERFCEKALQYLKGSQDQREEFPDSFISCISFLAVKGFYDQKLLQLALEMPDRKQLAYMNTETSLSYDLLNIDAFAKINLANSYCGPVLSNDLVAKLTEKHEHDSYNRKFLEDLKNIFDKNDHNYMECKPMPHIHGPNLFFVYNKRTNRTVKMNLPIDENKIMNAVELHQKWPDLKAVALMNCSTIFRSNKYNGFFQMKLNQLKSLGFEVIVFRKRDWNKNLDLDLKQWYLTLQLYKANIFLFNKNE